MLGSDMSTSPKLCSRLSTHWGSLNSPPTMQGKTHRHTHAHRHTRVSINEDNGRGDSQHTPLKVRIKIHVAHDVGEQRREGGQGKNAGCEGNQTLPERKRRAHTRRHNESCTGGAGGAWSGGGRRVRGRRSGCSGRGSRCGGRRRSVRHSRRRGSGGEQLVLQKGAPLKPHLMD